MSTTPFRTEGIILQSINFQDYDKILSLFTPNEGLIKAIVIGANRPKRKMPIEPLLQGEFILLQQRSEILKCQEMNVLNRYLKIRDQWTSLEIACDLLKAILQSQIPHKPAPQLYQLLHHYLFHFQKAANPIALSASFHLKILWHEGLLDPSMPSHSLEIGLSEDFLSPSEWELVSFLTTCRSWEQLTKQNVSPYLLQKIKHFFKLHLEH